MTTQQQKIEIIELVPFRRNEWDRGCKKVLIDGEQWGWIEMVNHGCHGPRYHLRDMHSVVTDTMLQDITCRGSTRRLRWDNKDNPAAKKTTDDLLRDMVVKAIDTGHLRSPAKRKAEIKAQRDKFEASQRKAAENEQASFEAKADEVVSWLDKRFFDEDALMKILKTKIIAAMKWAQTQ